MDLDKKMICYRQPKKGSTIDQWELRPVPVSNQTTVHEISYSGKKHNLYPALDNNGNPILLTIGLDPDEPPHLNIRCVKSNAYLIQCELFEPPGGWVLHVGWSLSQPISARNL